MINIAKEYKERNPKGHYFDSDTIKFWGSRVVEVDEQDNGVILFIDSIDNYNKSAKIYKISALSETGDIYSITFFNDKDEALVLYKTLLAKNFPYNYYSYATYIIDALNQAAKDWEDHGGNWAEWGELARANAKHWAKQAGFEVRWDCYKGNVYNGSIEITETLAYVAEVME